MQAIRSLPEFQGLLWCEPVPEPNSQFPDTVDAPDAGGQVRTEQTAVGRVIFESEVRESQGTPNQLMVTLRVTIG